MIDSILPDKETTNNLIAKQYLQKNNPGIQRFPELLNM
jgi:hypothetical protein